ncbi:UDP-N-acetylmuramate--L-alanine ligase, partial [Buchnera aphidicola (Hormaphis cornu)]
MKKTINFYNNNKIKHFHFIGIGGVGMSSIAKLLILEGYIISGSDLLPNQKTQELIHMGAKIYLRHCAKNIVHANVIIISSAIPLNNIEIISAKKFKIPILLRAQILAEIMHHKYGIAVSGSHGKTTTTGMIFSIYNNNKLYPSLINGGIVNEINSSSQLGHSKFIIAEADESDGSLIYLKPKMIILTNIDYEHIRNYQGNLNNLKKTFLKFINNLPSY